MKRTLVIGGALVIIVVILAIVLFSHHANETAAKVVTMPTHCFAANSQLQVTSSDRTNIEEAAASQLMTVPAGTQTTVNINTYDAATATGSELYPKTYGTYNFTAKKITTTASNQVTWKITAFTACTAS